MGFAAASNLCWHVPAAYLCSFGEASLVVNYAAGTAAADSSLHMCAAVAKQEKGPSNGKLYTEEDWNNESKPDKAGGYRYSKVWM